MIKFNNEESDYLARGKIHKSDKQKSENLKFIEKKPEEYHKEKDNIQKEDRKKEQYPFEKFINSIKHAFIKNLLIFISSMVLFRVSKLFSELRIKISRFLERKKEKENVISKIYKDKFKNKSSESKEFLYTQKIQLSMLRFDIHNANDAIYSFSRSAPPDAEDNINTQKNSLAASARQDACKSNDVLTSNNSRENVYKLNTQSHYQKCNFTVQQNPQIIVQSPQHNQGIAQQFNPLSYILALPINIIIVVTFAITNLLIKSPYNLVRESIRPITQNLFQDKSIVNVSNPYISQERSFSGMYVDNANNVYVNTNVTTSINYDVKTMQNIPETDMYRATSTTFSKTIDSYHETFVL